MARKLQPGQRAELHILHVDTGASELRHVSETLLFEAPNWSPDGRSLFINGDGRLFRLECHGGELAEGGPADNSMAQIPLAEIPLGEIAEINNDHLISPDGCTAYVSSEDGHLYAVDLAGTAGESAPGPSPRRVSNDNGAHFKHYLHGISPDGSQLAYIGLSTADGEVRTNVYVVPSAGGADTQLTNDHFADDGAEFSPDGRWIYFNSERGSTLPGHAQLFRMPAPGTEDSGAAPEQLTHDERVNWFPHPSPDGTRIAYISFPKGTMGHPADVPVVVRLLEADGTIRDLAHVFGGQGTMNVPSWSPDGSRIAIVAYPLMPDGSRRQV